MINRSDESEGRKALVLAELRDRSPQAGRKESETSLKFDSKESTSGGPTFAGHRRGDAPPWVFFG